MRSHRLATTTAVSLRGTKSANTPLLQRSFLAAAMLHRAFLGDLLPVLAIAGSLAVEEIKSPAGRRARCQLIRLYLSTLLVGCRSSILSVRLQLLSSSGTRPRG